MARTKLKVHAKFISIAINLVKVNFNKRIFKLFKMWYNDFRKGG